MASVSEFVEPRAQTPEDYLVAPESPASLSFEGYQAGFDKLSSLMPRSRQFFAEFLLYDWSTTSHHNRCGQKFQDCIPQLADAGLITPEEKVKMTKQGEFLYFHDIGKAFIRNSIFNAWETMNWKPNNNTDRSAGKDPRPSILKADMALHSLAGSLAEWELCNNLFSDLSKNELVASIYGIETHHTSPVDIYEPDGRIKVLYLLQNFVETPYLITKSNGLISWVDEYDAMKGKRNYRNSNIPEAVIKNQLKSIMPDDRLIKTFGCKPDMVNDTRDKLIEIVSDNSPQMQAMYEFMDHDPMEFMWGSEPLVQAGDGDFRLLREVAKNIWYKHENFLKHTHEMLVGRYVSSELPLAV